MRLSARKVEYKQLQRSRKSKLRLWGALLISVGLIGYGVYGFWQKHQAVSRPPAKVDGVVTYSTEKPDETPIKACDDFKAIANNPKKIVITSLGIDACIQRVGVDQNQAIAVPTNVHAAGWYVNSPVPGEKGVSIIDGHVQGRYSDAIFGKIKGLAVKENIKVIFGDDSERNFEVVSVDNYSVEETNTQQYVQLEDVERQLTLITCAGRYDAKSEGYDRRVVVRAKYIQ